MRNANGGACRGEMTTTRFSWSYHAGASKRGWPTSMDNRWTNSGATRACGVSVTVPTTRNACTRCATKPRDLLKPLRRPCRKRVRSIADFGSDRDSLCAGGLPAWRCRGPSLSRPLVRGPSRVPPPSGLSGPDTALDAALAGCSSTKLMLHLGSLGSAGTAKPAWSGVARPGCRRLDLDRAPRRPSPARSVRLRPRSCGRPRTVEGQRAILVSAAGDDAFDACQTLVERG